MYEVVMYMLQEPEKVLVVAKRPDKREAVSVMNKLAGPAWELDRRPFLHSFGKLILTVRRYGSP